MRILMWQERHPWIHGGAEHWLFDTMAGLRLREHTVEWLETGEIEKKVEEFKPDAIILGTIFCFIGIEHANYLVDHEVPSIWFMHDYWPFCGPRMLMRDNNRSDQGCEAAYGGKCTSCFPRPMEIQNLVNKFFIATGCEGTMNIMRNNGINVQAVVEEGINTDLFNSAPQRNNERVVYAHAAGDEVWKGGHILRQAMQDTDVAVKFLTGMSREAVADQLSVAQVYSFPSVYQEIWGLALTEAMCSGCAVVASDVTGAKAQIHEGTGLLVPHRDPDILRETIMCLLNDPELCRTLGNNAREHVLKDHGLMAIGERWEKLVYTLRHKRVEG